METTLFSLALVLIALACALAIYDQCVHAPIMDDSGRLVPLHGLHGQHVPVCVTEPSGVVRQYLYDLGADKGILESRIPSPFFLRMNPFRRKDNKRRVSLRQRAAWDCLLNASHACSEEV